MKRQIMISAFLKCVTVSTFRLWQLLGLGLQLFFHEESATSYIHLCLSVCWPTMLVLGNLHVVPVIY